MGHLIPGQVCKFWEGIMEEQLQRVKDKVDLIEEILRDVSDEWGTVMQWAARQGEKVPDDLYRAMEKMEHHLQRAWTG